MEQSRVQKLKRLVAVQRHLERMAENELAEVSKVRNEVLESMDRTVGAIGSDDPVHMAFSRQYSERLGRLTSRDQQLEAMQQMMETQVLKERAKADRLEERMYEAREIEDREAEENTLNDLTDQRFAGGAKSDF